MTVPPPARQDTDEIRQALEARVIRAMNDVGSLAWESLSVEEAERIEALVTSALNDCLARVHSLERVCSAADALLAGMWSYDEASRENLSHTWPVQASALLRAVVLEGAAGQEQDLGAPAPQARGTEQESQTVTKASHSPITQERPRDVDAPGATT